MSESQQNTGGGVENAGGGDEGNRGDNEQHADEESLNDANSADIQSQLDALPEFTVYIADFIDVLDPRWDLEGAGQVKPDMGWYVNKGHPFDKYTRIAFCTGFWCTLKDSVMAEEHLMFLLQNVKYKGQSLFALTEIEGQEEWNQGHYHLKQLYWPILQSVKEVYKWLKEDREGGPQVPGWWREDMLDRWVTSTSYTMRKRLTEGGSIEATKRKIPAGVPKLSSRQIKEKAKQVYPLYAMYFKIQDETSGRDTLKIQFPRIFTKSDSKEGVDIMGTQDSFTKLETILDKEIGFLKKERDLGYNVTMALGREEFISLADGTALRDYVYNHRRVAEQEMTLVVRPKALDG